MTSPYPAFNVTQLRIVEYTIEPSFQTGTAADGSGSTTTAPTDRASVRTAPRDHGVDEGVSGDCRSAPVTLLTSKVGQERPDPSKRGQTGDAVGDGPAR